MKNKEKDVPEKKVSGKDNSPLINLSFDDLVKKALNYKKPKKQRNKR